MRSGVVVVAFLAACWIHSTSSGPIQGTGNNQNVPDDASCENGCSSCEWVDVRKLPDRVYDSIIEYLADLYKGVINSGTKEKINDEAVTKGTFTTIDCIEKTTVVVPEDEIERKTISIDDIVYKSDDKIDVTSNTVISTATFTAKVPVLFISEDETTNHRYKVPEFTVPSLIEELIDNPAINAFSESIIEPITSSVETITDLSQVNDDASNIRSFIKPEPISTDLPSNTQTFESALTVTQQPRYKTTDSREVTANNQNFEKPEISPTFNSPVNTPTISRFSKINSIGSGNPKVPPNPRIIKIKPALRVTQQPRHKTTDSREVTTNNQHFEKPDISPTFAVTSPVITPTRFSKTSLIGSGSPKVIRNPRIIQTKPALTVTQQPRYKTTDSREVTTNNQNFEKPDISPTFAITSPISTPTRFTKTISIGSGSPKVPQNPRIIQTKPALTVTQQPRYKTTDSREVTINTQNFEKPDISPTFAINTPVKPVSPQVSKNTLIDSGIPGKYQLLPVKPLNPINIKPIIKISPQNKIKKNIKNTDSPPAYTDRTTSTKNRNDYVKNEADQDNKKKPPIPTLIIFDDNSDESWEESEESTTTESTYNPLADLILNSPSILPYSNPPSPNHPIKPVKLSEKYKTNESKLVLSANNVKLNPLANTILNRNPSGENRKTLSTQPHKNRENIFNDQNIKKHTASKPVLKILNDDEDDFSFSVEFNDISEESSEEITTFDFKEDTRDIKLQQIEDFKVINNGHQIKPQLPKNSKILNKPTKFVLSSGIPKTKTLITTPNITETDGGTLITYDEVTTIDVEENAENQPVTADKNKKDCLVLPKDGKLSSKINPKRDINLIEKVTEGIYTPKISPSHYRKLWDFKRF